jgi:biopolymer transport protein ExbD
MRRAARVAFASVADRPIVELNTTPLIDVMLVLLIMFIITIPLATHAVKLNLPIGIPLSQHEPKVHRIDLGAGGRIAWDGAPMHAADLPGRLDAFLAVRDDAVLELRADGGARYEDFDRLLATVKRSGIERLAFVGNERFADSAGR